MYQSYLPAMSRPLKAFFLAFILVFVFVVLVVDQRAWFLVPSLRLAYFALTALVVWVWFAQLLGWRVSLNFFSAANALTGACFLIFFDPNYREYRAASLFVPSQLAFAAFWVGFWGSQREARFGVTLIALGASLYFLTYGLYLIGVGMLIPILGTFWIARALRTRDEAIYLLRQAQAELVRQAELHLRRGIAREVHDVVAHSLAVTMLHVTGARYVLRKNPEKALAALEEAERSGRQSMADLRKVIGLLGGSPGVQALPSALDIRELVESVRATGIDLRSTIQGDLDSIPPVLGLDLYRIIQEALTNIVKHAPLSSAELELRVQAGNVWLRVSNSLEGCARVEGQGMGLKNMRERATLHKGVFHIETDEGRWSVQLSIPMEV